MRIPFVAGNWKMNKTIAETRDLLSALLPTLSGIDGVERVVCPPYPALMTASELVAGRGVGLGAQDMHWEEKGAFTGEVAPGMVGELCGYVILGHSERRAYFGETDETVNKKLLAAQKAGLTPIVCIGETLAQYEAGETAKVVSSQTRLGLQGVSAEFAPTIVVAYEPVWAIGTGKASSAENAQGVHGGVIRPVLKELFGAETAQSIRILYGGSVTAANAAEFFSQPDIDGALVGGASLKPEDFISIVRAAQK
ncbi:MAG: triose-phosphate isomerase [Anaerolineales bacterium]|nr:triose-phosphate isomerase [Chloroflexota bacterium]MBK6645405.1 triose-phosphate isomerase [Anaerolineales bacterium]MCC6985002.1 triose-phosphate isomerase [Anaerolineales bacterium]